MAGIKRALISVSRQDGRGGNGERACGAGGRGSLDRRNGKSLARGRCEGNRCSSLHWLTGNSGRPRQDAAPQDSWRPTGTAFGTSPC